MKYLKRFQNNADYQAFKGGDNWLLPNLSAIEDSIDFPVRYNPIPQSSTFTIINNASGMRLDWTSKTLEFMPGMTWSEWVDSEYNTINGLIYSDYYFEVSGPGGYARVELNNSTDQTKDMEIIEGETYSLRHISNCCFIDGTQVLTSLDGSTCNIKDLKVGDQVVSYSFERGENYESIVKDQILNTKSINMAKVTCADGTVLEMTDYHPLYTKDGWKSLTNFNGYETLKVGDIVKTVDDWSEIVSIERYSLEEPITTYTLNVIDNDERIDNDMNDGFYANGVLAHNAASPC
jgi:hypothetical protein